MQIKTSNVLFVESLSYITFIIAILSKLVGIDVVVFKINSNLLRKKVKLLNTIGIKIVSFSDLPIVHPSVINGDIQDSITKCVEELFPNYDFFNFFQDLFPGVEDLGRKLKIFIRQYVGYNFWDYMGMIHWLENSEYKNSRIILIASLTSGGRLLWNNSALDTLHVMPQGLWFIQLFLSHFWNLLKQAFSKFLNKFKGGGNHSEINKSDGGGINGEAEVVYFPHLSIFCGNSFVKDHFYADDTDSPFHVTNIQHIEYDKRADISKDSKRAMEYMGVYSIQYNALPMVNYKDYLKSAFHFIVFICRNIRGLFAIDGVTFSSVLGIAMLYMMYMKYFISISCLKKTKIALVGYDFLFPKGLSLALEARGIRTVAIQERIVATFVNSVSYILDTQMTVSPYVDQYIMSKKSHFYVKRCVPVGQIRTDHFFDDECKNAYSHGFSRMVVVLDYHVVPDTWHQQVNPIVNWANDRSFRQEILRLAGKYPDVAFIFRGKNDDWLRNNHFKDIVQKVNTYHNVSVDSEYGIWNRSYHLCSAADLIIAKPTSLAEECMSMGYNVLVADYGINYAGAISVFFPHSDQGNYCHSFVELEEKFDFFIKHGYVVEPEKMQRMIDELFGGLSDGHVRTRVQRQLHLMLQLEKPSETHC